MFLIALCISVISCKKHETDPSPQAPWLMTVNFTDEFINPKLKAIVFISDSRGVSLADTLVSGNPRIVMQGKAAISLPLQVTIAKWEPDMHNFLVSVNTYLNVYPSEWTIRGNRPVSDGDATVTLANIPAHSGPILYSTSGYSNLTFITSNSKNPVYRTPDDLYIRLITQGGQLYKWEHGVIAGNTYETDLSSMGQSQLRAVTFPFQAQDFKAIVEGNRDTSDISALSQVTDEQIGDGTAVNSVMLGFPANVFQNFHTYIELIESWASPLTYSYSKEGQIPQAFIKTNAMINLFQTTGSSARFAGSGIYSVSKVRWNFQDTARLAFDWIVYGPDTLSTVKLPLLPPSMTSMFPTLAPDSLKLYQIELIHYPAIKSWNDFLEMSFSPSTPGRIKRFESSAVRMQIN